MTLDDLHLAIAHVSVSLGLEASQIREDIGLLLCEPSPGADTGYAATPLNSILFAWMGVDGCHWVFLELPGRPLHECPVIQVMPMEWDYMCEGENLGDFIEQRCAFCESLWLENDPNCPTTPEQRAQSLSIIAAVREQLGLSHVPYDDAYAERLTARYAKLLELRPEDFQYPDQDIA